MKLRLLFSFGLALLFGTATVRADITWETNYRTALARSRATGKPLFIDIYTDWCGWCKKLDAEVYPDPRVQQLARSYVMLRLNAEGSGATTAKAFRVTSYPTLIFASSRGQMLSNKGYLKTADFLATMQGVLQANGPAMRTPRATRKSATRMAKSRLVQPQKARSVSNWQAMPELRRVVQSGNYGGAYVLGGNGAVALDAPAKKAVKSAKMHSAARAQ